MSTKVDLPDGGWAELYETGEIGVGRRRMLKAALGAAAPATLKISRLVPPDLNRQEREKYLLSLSIEEAMSEAHLDETDYAALDRLETVAIVAFLRSWSLALPLPTTATIDEEGAIPMDVYLALTGPCAELARRFNFETNYEPTKARDDEPGNPTGSASG